MPPSELATLLHDSSATEAFKSDVRLYLAHRPAPRIALARPSPRVKVVRLLTHLLSCESTLAIDRVEVSAASGCSDFRGWAVVGLEGEGERTFDFVWDCQWRAMQEGWTDAFGLPDQIRAARVYDWRCFASWRQRTGAAEPVVAGR